MAAPPQSPQSRTRLLSRASYPSTRSSILVAVTFDDGSLLALQRGHALARLCRLPLELVHVIPVLEDVGSAAPRPAKVMRHVAAPTRALSARGAVQRWIRREVGYALPSEAIEVRFGDPRVEISRAAEERALILVVGGRPSIEAPAPGAVVDGLLRRCGVPVLVASTPHVESVVVVGTDLTRRELPVVRGSTRLAFQLGASLTVVHNIDDEAALARRYGVPIPTAAATRLAARRLEILERVGASRVPCGTALTDERSAADGILSVARAQDADLVVVGKRHESAFTSRALVHAARRSVLAIPLRPRLAPADPR